MLILTPELMLKWNLLLVCHSEEQQARVNQTEWLARFTAEFGKVPAVLANIWNNSQQTQITDAKMGNAMDHELVKFLSLDICMAQVP